MAKDPPAQDLMNYEAMAQEALKGVVRAALRRANAPGGLPGAHHFYLTFKTGAAGVEGPEELLSRYPDEMTIVLQHQFWDLEIGDEAFGVTLKFGGRPQSLRVPYAALTRFYDPSVQFLLQFDAEDSPASSGVSDLRSPAAPATGEGLDPDAPNVVSLDHFRKK
ncbi:MAG: SspB family protein [Phenylobacterium sp.]|jgi:hypothetical protein